MFIDPHHMTCSTVLNTHYLGIHGLVGIARPTSLKGSRTVQQTKFRALRATTASTAMAIHIFMS